MKIIAFAVIALVVAGFLINRPVVRPVDAKIPEDFPEDGFSHRLLEDLLASYVDDAGHIDYESWHASHDDLRKLAQYLAAVSRYSPENAPSRFPTRNDALAYWIYGYNAYVLSEILGRWPLDSVRDVKAPLEIVKGFGFFYRLRFVFGGEAYNLLAVENDKIRARYRDPRIHFVLNCGSDSCPVLRTDFFAPDELETQLGTAAAEFVADPKNVWIDHENQRIELSRIFKWYKGDFVNELRRQGLPAEQGLIGYIGTVADARVRAELERSTDYELLFREFDWTVNESRNHEALQ